MDGTGPGRVQRGRSASADASGASVQRRLAAPRVGRDGEDGGAYRGRAGAPEHRHRAAGCGGGSGRDGGDGGTPLYLAAAKGYVEIAERLLERGARLDVMNGEDGEASRGEE